MSRVVLHMQWAHNCMLLVNLEARHYALLLYFYRNKQLFVTGGAVAAAQHLAVPSTSRTHLDEGCRCKRCSPANVYRRTD
jgi:hypothetical protein